MVPKNRLGLGMNFVVENSNKLQQIRFRRENELSVFTFGANNTCYHIYP
jgi:hypothetical protein